MKITLPRALLITILALLMSDARSIAATPLGTAFTYQGRLNNGTNAANGNYDFRFTVYDSANTAGNIIAGPVTISATRVSSGLFSVTLDFGAGVFDGAARWLEIGVRTNGSAAGFTVLSPRQQLAAVPYALYALTPAGPPGPAGTSFNHVPDIKAFTANETFVVPTNVTKIMVELWGAGGGGGAGYKYGTNAWSGGGGGAGGYAWNVFNVTSNTSYSVVGGVPGQPGEAGGTSSFGNLLSATGGSPGASATSTGHGAGGSGGVSSAGSIAPVRGWSGKAGNYYGQGAGGQVWRGNNGPGTGGDGGGPGEIGRSGDIGAVIVYY